MNLQSRKQRRDHRSRALRFLYLLRTAVVLLLHITQTIIDFVSSLFCHTVFQASKKRAASSKRKNDSPKQWLSVLSTALQGIKVRKLSRKKVKKLNNKATAPNTLVRGQHGLSQPLTKMGLYRLYSLVFRRIYFCLSSFPFKTEIKYATSIKNWNGLCLSGARQRTSLSGVRQEAAG